eukprot:10729786-Ditylum_brightwellii.AAC.1
MRQKRTAQNASNKRDDIPRALAASSFQQMYNINAVLDKSALLKKVVIRSAVAAAIAASKDDSEDGMAVLGAKVSTWNRRKE